jgi:hypothetical protein
MTPCRAWATVIFFLLFSGSTSEPTTLKTLAFENILCSRSNVCNGPAWSFPLTARLASHQASISRARPREHALGLEMSDTGLPASKMLDDSDVSGVRTIAWLMERTKGRATQFDLILQSSKQRMNIRAQLLDVQSQVCRTLCCHGIFVLTHVCMCVYTL